MNANAKLINKKKGLYFKANGLFGNLDCVAYAV